MAMVGGRNPRARQVQKAAGWAESVKRLVGRERATNSPQGGLLGSAPLLVQRGLSENLAAVSKSAPSALVNCRMRAARLHTEQYCSMALPGCASLAGDPQRWAATSRLSHRDTIARDCPAHAVTNRPCCDVFRAGVPVLRQCCPHQDARSTANAGNTITLAHTSISGWAEFVGLPKYAGPAVRSRGSSPTDGSHTLSSRLSRPDTRRARSDTSSGDGLSIPVGAHIWAMPRLPGCARSSTGASATEVDYV